MRRLAKPPAGLLFALAVACGANVALAAADGPGSGVITVLDVAPGSPAEAAGVQAADRLLSLAGTAIASLPDLESALTERVPGDRVELVVLRAGEEMALEVALGPGPSGTSLGASLAAMTEKGAEQFARDMLEGLDSEGCHAWIGSTYRLSEAAESLQVDLADRLAELRACVQRDLDRMPARIPKAWCDNVFKIHCSGLDLLTELGEAQVTLCEKAIADAVGAAATRSAAWRRCGADRVFERFSTDGELSDAAACRAALEECGYDGEGDDGTETGGAGDDGTDTGGGDTAAG